MSGSSSEEEEQIEETLMGARTPVSHSVKKDLLRPTSSQSRTLSAGDRHTATPPHGSLKTGPRVSTTVTPEKTISASDPTPLNKSAASTSKSRSLRKSTNDGISNARPDNLGEGSSTTVATRTLRPGDTQTVHGPLANLNDPLFIDLVSSASSSSSRSAPRIAKYKGAPFVEVPLLPLHRLRQYTKPDSRRHPTALSRNDQLRYHQTPPPSSGDSDFAILERSPSPPPRPTRAAAARTAPRWKTRTDTESSPDLGGYGFDESSAGDSDSDLPTRRSMRSKGKEKEVRTRSGAKVRWTRVPRSSKDGVFSYPWLLTISVADLSEISTISTRLDRHPMKSVRCRRDVISQSMAARGNAKGRSSLHRMLLKMARARRSWKATSWISVTTPTPGNVQRARAKARDGRYRKSGTRMCSKHTET